MDKAHLQALETKHAGLDARIQAEHRHPQPDNRTLAELKKAKLRLKDEIERT